MKRIALLLLTGIGITYQAIGRRWVLEWGATESEAAAPLAGDELIGAADGVSTRAITINAPAEQVWPWIVQIGPAPRGGVYTYDWIENLLGLNMHSVDELLPEFQNPKVGDVLEMGTNRMVIELVDPNRAIAWRSDNGNWVWSFVLRDLGGKTRLISRNSFKLPRVIDKIGMAPMEPASLIMERKMLLGIKARAERS